MQPGLTSRCCRLALPAQPPWEPGSLTHCHAAAAALLPPVHRPRTLPSRPHAPPCHAPPPAPLAGLPALLEFYRQSYFLPTGDGSEPTTPQSIAIADPSEYFVAQAVVTASE